MSKSWYVVKECVVGRYRRVGVLEVTGEPRLMTLRDRNVKRIVRMWDGFKGTESAAYDEAVARAVELAEGLNKGDREVLRRLEA